MDPLKVLSIDVGISNLGYIYGEIYFPEIEKTSKYKNLQYNKEYNKVQENIKIIDCGRIDITKVQHLVVKECDCKLHHENCIPDYLDHFIQEYSFYFNNCDILLIERQPPMGITNVQDLLFTKFRDKVLLISPNSVHKYFKLNNDYQTRKKESEKIANGYLSGFKSFINNIRKHDISDALLMVIYYYKIKMDIFIEENDYTHNPVIFEEFKFNFLQN